MCVMIWLEYRSCTCAGSNPVSGDGKATRSVRSAGAVAERAARVAEAPAARKRRRSIGSGAAAAGGIDVDVFEEVAAVRMAAVAHQPRMHHVVDEAVSVHLV